MQLLDDLKEFIGPTIIEAEIEYKGKTRIFHFKELSVEQAQNLVGGLRDVKGNIDPKKEKAFNNKVIASILCGSDGSQITEADAKEVPFALSAKLVQTALEINGLREKKEGSTAGIETTTT